MNNRQIAIDVFKHPLIQEILKRKLAESSIINRLIVEEVTGAKQKELENLSKVFLATANGQLEREQDHAAVRNSLIKRFKEKQSQLKPDEYDYLLNLVLSHEELKLLPNEKNRVLQRSKRKLPPLESVKEEYSKLWDKFREVKRKEEVLNYLIQQGFHKKINSRPEPHTFFNNLHNISKQKSKDIDKIKNAADILKVAFEYLDATAPEKVPEKPEPKEKHQEEMELIRARKTLNSAIDATRDVLKKAKLTGEKADVGGRVDKLVKYAIDKTVGVVTGVLDIITNKSVIGELEGKIKELSFAPYFDALNQIQEKSSELENPQEISNILIFGTPEMTDDQNLVSGVQNISKLTIADWLPRIHAASKAAGVPIDSNKIEQAMQRVAELAPEAEKIIEPKSPEAKELKPVVSNVVDNVDTDSADTEEIIDLVLKDPEVQDTAKKLGLDSEEVKEVTTDTLEDFDAQINFIDDDDVLSKKKKTPPIPPEKQPESEGPFLDSLEDADTKQAFRKFIEEIKKDDKGYLLEAEEVTVPVDDWLEKFAHDTIPRIFREKLETNEQQLIIDALRDPKTLERFLALFKPDALSSEEETTDTDGEEEETTDTDGEEETTDTDGEDEEETGVDTTDASEEEELPPTSPISEEKKKQFIKTKDHFIQWFLRVPFLQDQQRLLINLLDVLDFTKGEKARIGKPEGETASPPEEKVAEALTEENQIAPLRTTLRRVDNNLRTLNTSLKFYLYGGRSTKKGSSRYKNQIVESIKELQELIVRAYTFLSEFAPTITEEEVDYSKDENAITAVEQAFEEARVALGDITTAIEGGKNVGQLVALASVVQEILRPILMYYPKTANFTETAKMSAREAFEELQEVITLFHSRTLVPLYIQLKDDSLTAADIEKGKNGLIYLATMLEKLLGVSNPISDVEDEVPPDAPAHTETPVDPASPEYEDFDAEVEEVDVEEEDEIDDEEDEDIFSLKNVEKRIIKLKNYLKKADDLGIDPKQQIRIINRDLQPFLENENDWALSYQTSDDIYPIEEMSISPDDNSTLVISYTIPGTEGSATWVSPPEVLERFFLKINPLEENYRSIEEWALPEEKFDEQIIKKLKPIIERLLGGYDG